ncbi:MAG: sugar phosphate isomerase/epimerase [Armatimonadetes bacterium]|nr:sugar phosphate isomerase/epimerase [Armatimonadota bacterium]
MKAGVCQWVFNAPLTSGEMDMYDCIEFVGRETEADCFEPLSRYWADGEAVAEQARRARELLDEVGLEVSCYTLDSDFAVYDQQRFEVTVADCIRSLDIAEILGTDTIRLDPRTSLPPEHADSPDLDYILERVSEGMQQVADAAADRGMTVGVENHGLLLGRSAQVMRMVELVDRPNFGVNIDFTNFRHVFGEDHVAATRLLAPYVVHAHIKDFYLRTEEPPDAEAEGWRETRAHEWIKPAVGGTGDMQWPLLISIIHEAGYDGTVSLEISLPEDIPGSVRQGVANLQRVLAEVEAG